MEHAVVKPNFVKTWDAAHVNHHLGRPDLAFDFQHQIGAAVDDARVALVFR
jgi:hypothetical protein